MAEQDQGGAKPSTRLAPNAGAHHATTALIDELVAQRVIPTLVQSHSVAGRPADGAEANRLARLAAQGDEPALHTALDQARREGRSSEAVLTETANALGALWEQDTLNFSQVTMATAKLQRWHRGQGERLGPSRRERPAHRILLATLRGEGHSLGLALAASAFQEAGWAVEGGPGLSEAQLRAQVRMHWFDALGFSLSTERTLAPLAKLIRDLRAQSKNSQLRVVVGGALVAQRKDIVEALGVDAAFSTASGAPDALAAQLPAS